MGLLMSCGSCFLVVFIVYSFCIYISSLGSLELLALESLHIDVTVTSREL
jgi:hypothetical protein